MVRGAVAKRTVDEGASEAAAATAAKAAVVRAVRVVGGGGSGGRGARARTAASFLVGFALCPILHIPLTLRRRMTRDTTTSSHTCVYYYRETASPAQVYEQYNATGLGAWYLSMTTLPPHLRDDEAAFDAETFVDASFNAAETPTRTFVAGPADLPAPRSGPPSQAAALATVRARNTIQRDFVGKTRLGIPVTFIMETLHSGGPDGTIFPMPINYASTWNASAMKLAAVAIADEARSVGTDRGFSPVINMFPDPRYVADTIGHMGCAVSLGNGVMLLLILPLILPLVYCQLILQSRSLRITTD